MMGLIGPYSAWFFLASIILLLVGHVMRALRMTTFFAKSAGVGRFDLLLSLALGYSVNTVIPARLGEVVRVLYIGKRCHIRYPQVAATVICERLSDALVLGMICGGLVITGVIPTYLSNVAMDVTVLAALALILGFFIRDSRFVRRHIWRLASIFNPTICYGLLDLAWSYSELLISGPMLRLKYLILTILMWVSYGCSYLLFATAAYRSITLVVGQMLGSPLSSMLERTLHGRFSNSEFVMLAFSFIPLAVILGFGLFTEKTSLVRVCSLLFRGHFRTWDSGSSLVSEHFKEHDEYNFFLTSLFAEEDKRVTGFGLNAIEDAVVHRLFQGGSGAITALVESKDQLMIRKFAIGEIKNKLQDQVDWIKEYQQELPLVHVLAERTEQAFYRYDMPYSSTANDFYDVIHTAPIQQSLALITDVIGTVDDFHNRHLAEPASNAVLDRYGQEKVTKNAEAILQFVSDLIPRQRYRLNSKEYDLADWAHLRDSSWLRNQMGDRRVTQVHGDLTIENIIIDPAQPRGWYLIDPNPGNVFDSPYIDWAKLRQSLHLGYEGLNKAASCSWKGSDLYIAFTRSHAYDQMNGLVEATLQQRLGSEAHREIRFHELVNYVRLTPYKIRQDQTKGLAFFACTSMLLASYLEDYR